LKFFLFFSLRLCRHRPKRTFLFISSSARANIFSTRKRRNAETQWGKRRIDFPIVTMKVLTVKIPLKSRRLLSSILKLVLIYWNHRPIALLDFYDAGKNFITFFFMFVEVFFIFMFRLMIYDQRLELKLMESDDGVSGLDLHRIHFILRQKSATNHLLQCTNVNLISSFLSFFFLSSRQNGNSWFNQNYPEIIIIASI
jgi:hypothetical protein